MAKVEIYTTATCPYCINAKQLLRKKNIKFSEIAVDTNAEKMSEMLRRADGRRTVPQIFINGVGVGGLAELQELERSGLLDEKLKQN